MPITRPSGTRTDRVQGKKTSGTIVNKFLYQDMYTDLGKQIKFKASSQDSVIPAAHMPWKNSCNLNEREKKEENYLVGMAIIVAVPDDQRTTCCTNSVKAHKVDNPDTILYPSDIRPSNTAIKKPVT